MALFNTTNSSGVLKGVGGNASDLRTGGITFDENGILWGVQSLVNTPLYSINQEGDFTAYSLSPGADGVALKDICLLYTSPSPRDRTRSRMPSSA